MKRRNFFLIALAPLVPFLNKRQPGVYFDGARDYLSSWDDNSHPHLLADGGRGVFSGWLKEGELTFKDAKMESRYVDLSVADNRREFL
jgi:hypothetical protein